MRVEQHSYHREPQYGTRKKSRSTHSQAVLSATIQIQAVTNDAVPHVSAGRVLNWPRPGKAVKMNSMVHAIQPIKERSATTLQTLVAIQSPAPEQAADFQFPDHQHRFPDYFFGHFGLPCSTVDKNNRYFTDTGTKFCRPEMHLNLE